MIAGYRATMFDGETELDWLRHGWRALRLYGRKAKAAILAGDIALKAEMMHRADRLLVLLTGILDTGPGTTLGPALTTIYGTLQTTLLRANLQNDAAALDEFDRAIETLARDMLETPEPGTAS
ncbi:flagellar protein FliS [Acidocella sp.]|uniref:flagellar protein FliS n=1 Tax=Acidocella sp. TaxID=50710 RepID=UPI002F425DD3